MKRVLVLLLFMFSCVHPEDKPEPRAFMTAEAPASGVSTAKIKNSGKCLDISGSSTADFAQVQVWDCNGTDAQKFRFQDYDQGYFSIVNIRSGRCLDARGGSAQRGTDFVQYTCSGAIGHNQQFKLGPNGSLIARHSGLCLAAEGGGTKNGTRIIQWDCKDYGANKSFSWSGGSPSTPPPPSTNGWKLVWADEFNGNGDVDRSRWSYEVWRPGTVNNERQAYTDNRRENVRVGNGVLTIEARRDGYGGEFSSGRIKSQGKASFTYGRFEARIKLPQGGRGSWPAFWMMPDNQSRGWPYCGEIDIMEWVSYDPGLLHGTIHTGAYNHLKGTQKEGKTGINPKEWNTYGIEWDQDKIVWTVNGKEYHRFTRHGGDDQWPFNKPFHIILNFAVGGDWGAALGMDYDFPRQMLVDYVRVYQR